MWGLNTQKRIGKTCINGERVVEKGGYSFCSVNVDSREDGKERGY